MKPRCSKMLLRLLLFLVIFNLISSGHSYTLWDWQDRQRRRVERQSKRLFLSDHQKHKEFPKPKHRVEPEDNRNNEIEDKPDSVPTLNVSSKDSPYALIDRFFPEREYNHEFMERNFQEKLKNGSFDDDVLGNLKPNEVWLSDGDLLVLKGGASNQPNRKSFDAPWKPLDDYVAPYREPKLPPPDFIPSDTGVGVALPPENEDEITAPVQPLPVAPVTPVSHVEKVVANIKKISTKHHPFKSFLFDEERFISQMENFHSKRRDELLNSLEMPRLQINLVDSPAPPPVQPTPWFTTPAKYNTTPRFTPTPTPTIIRSTTAASTTTTALPSTTPSSAGFYVSTSTPSSYSYAYQNEAVHENAKLVSSIARSTTTQSTTTTQRPTPTLVVRQLHPRNPKSYFIKPTFKPTYKPSNFWGEKVAPPPGALLSNEIDTDNKVAEERHDHYYAKHLPRPHWKKPKANPRARRKSFFSAGGPTLASTVISSLKPRYYRPFAPRRPPILPTPSTRRISTAGDHRYVSFYRGQIGGQSWGYSYHL